MPVCHTLFTSRVQEWVVYQTDTWTVGKYCLIKAVKVQQLHGVYVV